MSALTCALLTIGTVEVEAVERFARGQSCLGKVTLDAAATEIGDLVLGKRRQEASCGPAFLESSARGVKLALQSGYLRDS